MGLPEGVREARQYLPAIIAQSRGTVPKAKAAKYQGTVVLDVVVSAQGRTERIIVVKGPGLGLEEKSIEAVKKWKFKPATGPDGNPVAVRIPIEITFRLY
jgi:periplasmic protein TonB